MPSESTGKPSVTAIRQVIALYGLAYFYYKKFAAFAFSLTIAVLIILNVLVFVFPNQLSWLIAEIPESKASKPSTTCMVAVSWDAKIGKILSANAKADHFDEQCANWLSALTIFQLAMEAKDNVAQGTALRTLMGKAPDLDRDVNATVKTLLQMPVEAARVILHSGVCEWRHEASGDEQRMVLSCRPPAAPK